MHGDRCQHEVTDVGFSKAKLISEHVDQTALIGVNNYLNDLTLWSL